MYRADAISVGPIYNIFVRDERHVARYFTFSLTPQTFSLHALNHHTGIRPKSKRQRAK